MRRCLLAVLLVCTALSAQEINVIFVGLTKGAGPAFEQRYSDAVREKLAVRHDMHLIDQLDTKKLMSMVNFYDFPYVSRNFVDKLMRYSPDSTLIVWGRTEDFKISARRRGMWRAQAVGRVSLVLTMFSLNYDEYAFIGKVRGDSELKKRPIGFNKVEKVMHITADERSRLTNDLSNQVAEKTVSLVTAVVRNRLLKEGPVQDMDVDMEEIPSIFDVLEMPSVGGENVEQPTDEGAPELPTLPGFE